MLYLPVCQQQFAKISRKSAVYFYFPPSTLCLQAKKNGREATGMKESRNQNKTKNQENTNQEQNQNGNQNNQNRNNR